MVDEEIPIASVEAESFEIPTETPESDGTLEWDSTTMVLVTVTAGGQRGIGYTYCHQSAGVLINSKLAGVLKGRNALATRECWHALVHEIRNLGRPGLVSCAIAACDVALHDLKARLLGVPVATLLGRRRDHLPVYGSGGFTSYTERQLAEQLGRWASEGMFAVKMKIGRDPAHDLDRVRAARKAIGKRTGLFVDANGAYARKEALAFAERFAEHEVSWFEEPVSSNDIDGLRLIRDRAPAGIEISAGEYGYDIGAFRTLCSHGCVDVLQADATRCAGLTGFLMADTLAHAFELPLSSHTAPSLHLHACCAGLRVRHMEWFFDHVRIERMLFDGTPQPKDGMLSPDWSRPGLGLELKCADAERYRV